MGGYVISCPPGHVIESMAVCEEVAEQARAKFALATQGAVILPEPYLSWSFAHTLGSAWDWKEKKHKS